jgi:hypothetical protein
VPSRELRCWRVFPWDPAARRADRFSPEFVPPHQGSGRFDMDATPVTYLAETPEHAVAEKIGRFRGRVLRDHHLIEFGKRLAIVWYDLSEGLTGRIVDLCDPATLVRHDIRPDSLAARDARVSQAAAKRVYGAGAAGFRWWSSYIGEWHTVVLFMDLIEAADLSYGSPEHLELTDARVRAAAGVLGMRIGE